MSQENDGVPIPSESNARWYKVVSPKKEAPIKATLLADRFTGQWVHWEGRAYPCSNSRDCWRCRSGQPNRWCAYIAAYDLVARERIVLALTEGAARALLPIKAKYGTLRGVAVTLTRVYADKNNSKVAVKLVNRENPDEIMPAHPIQDSLNRLFGLNENWYRTHQPAQPAYLADDQGDGDHMPRRAEDDIPVPDPAESRAFVKRLIRDTFGE